MKHIHSSNFDVASEAKRITACYDDASGIIEHIALVIILHDLDNDAVTLLTGYIMYYLDDDVGFDFLQLLENNY